MARSNRPVYRAWLVALTLLAFALRVWRVDFQPLWWDEGLSIYRTGLSWAGIVAESYDNVHPPGYFFLLALWSRFAGPGVVATRLLSVFFDTLSIPLLAAVGARLGGRRIGLAAAALMAVSPFHIYHAQQARMYALVPCLVLVATMLLLRIEATSRLGRRQAKLLPAAYVVTLAAALHVHYFSIFIPAVHTAYVLVRRRIPLRRWVATLAATAALCLPWALVIGRQVVTSAASKVEAEGSTPLGPLAYLVRYLATLSGGYNISADPLNRGTQGEGGVVYLALILAALGAAAWRRRRAADRHPALPVLWVGVPLVGGYFVNLRVPFDSFPRLLAFTGPGLWLLWAAAFVEAWDRRRWLVLLTGATAMLVSTVSLARHYTVPREPEEDYRPLAAQLLSLAGSDDEDRRRDIVIADFPWQAGYLRAYAPAIASRVWLPPGARWAAEEGMMERDLADLVDAADASGATPSRVWYVAYQGMGGTKGRNIEAWLTGNTFLARDAWFGDTRLLLFGGGRQEREADVGAASDWSTLDIPVGDAIRLAAARLAIADVATGDVLPVELRWEASAQPAGRYKVFAHLVDAAGAVVAQHDAEPAFGARPTADWAPGDGIDDAFGIQVPWATPAGEYRLVAGMYDPATGERLPAGTPDNRIAVGMVGVHDPDGPR